MRYIRGYDQHRKNRVGPVNEEFIGGLLNFVKSMYSKVKAGINKIKGGKKCEEIYKRYLQIISTEIAKKANIDLSISATLQAEPAETEKQAVEKKPVPQNASVKWSGGGLLAEAEEPKLTPEEIAQQNKSADEAESAQGEKNKKIGMVALKEKRKLIDQIIALYKAKALKEMDLILKNSGGAEKNPKLAQIIDNFKDQFQVDLLSAQMRYLEKSGNKNEANKLATELQRRNKELAAKWNLDRVEFAKIQVGDKSLNIGGIYRYNGSRGQMTVKVKRVSPTPGEVIATYVYGDTQDREQSFKAVNIDDKFVPEIEGQYAYWSNTNQAGIKVTVVGKPDNRGMVEVSLGDKKFRVYSGALVGDGKEVDLSVMNPESQKPQSQGGQKEGQAGEEKKAE